MVGNNLLFNLHSASNNWIKAFLSLGLSELAKVSCAIWGFGVWSFKLTGVGSVMRFSVSIIWLTICRSIDARQLGQWGCSVCLTYLFYPFVETFFMITMATRSTYHGLSNPETDWQIVQRLSDKWSNISIVSLFLWRVEGSTGSLLFITNLFLCILVY